MHNSNCHNNILKTFYKVYHFNWRIQIVKPKVSLWGDFYLSDIYTCIADLISPVASYWTTTTTKISLATADLEQSTQFWPSEIYTLVGEMLNKTVTLVSEFSYVFHWLNALNYCSIPFPRGSWRKTNNNSLFT